MCTSHAILFTVHPPARSFVNKLNEGIYVALYRLRAVFTKDSVMQLHSRCCRGSLQTKSCTGYKHIDSITFLSSSAITQVQRLIVVLIISSISGISHALLPGSISIIIIWASAV